MFWIKLLANRFQKDLNTAVTFKWPHWFINFLIVVSYTYYVTKQLSGPFITHSYALAHGRCFISSVCGGMYVVFVKKDMIVPVVLNFRNWIK